MSFFSGLLGGGVNISAQDAHRMMEEQKDYVLLDVRTPEEYKEGRIKGSTLIPVDELAGRAAAELPDKNKLILVYCQSGMRAGSAARMLKKMGYANVYNLGGIMGWPYGTIRG